MWLVVASVVVVFLLYPPAVKRGFIVPGILLCVWGMVRGQSRRRRMLVNPVCAMALFWTSLAGWLVAAADIFSMLLVSATRPENAEEDLNPAYFDVWRLTGFAMRVCFFSSLVFHVLLFFQAKRTQPDRDLEKDER
jgi:hypothetical protein